MAANKIIIIFVFIIIAAGLYLYLANAYVFYNFGRLGLKVPSIASAYTFNATAAGDTIIYAALGDSLTSGLGLFKYEEAYPYLLANDLASSGGGKVALENFSFPGYRTDDLINGLLEPAIAVKPGLVTLLIGTNDVYGLYSKEKFKKNYQYILGRLTKETQAEIYVLSLPYIGSGVFLPPSNYYYELKTREFNEIIKGLAGEYGVNYIDIAEETKGEFSVKSPYYATDEFHPSAAGQALWEKIIFDNIGKGR